MTPQDIDARLREIEAIKLSDYPHMIALAQQTLAQSQQMNYLPGIVASLNYIGWGYNRLNQYSNAIQPTKTALLLSREYGLREAEGYALRNMVVCLYFTHQHEEELRTTHLQLAIGEEVSNPELIASAHHDLASLYYERNNFDLSNQHFERCVQVAEANHLDYILSFAYIGQANILQGQGKLAEKIALYQRALEAARRSDFTVGVAQALRNLSELSLGNDDIDQAIVFAGQIDPASIEYPVQQAAIARKLGQPEVAIRLLEEMLDRFEIPYRSPYYRTLAEIHAEIGSFEAAFRWQQKVNSEMKDWYEQQFASRIEVLTALHELDTLKRELAEQQRTENERIARQRAELELAQQQQIMDIKRELLIRISHEFRTPLAIIRTSFDILNRYSDRLTPERKAEHLKKIDMQYVVLQQMLESILDVLRAKDVTLPFEDQPLYHEL